MTALNQSTSPSKTPKILLGITIALLATVIAVGGFVYSGVSKALNAIPTPSDLVAALEPTPYTDITAAVITSVKDMAELTTVEMTEYVIVEKGTDEGWLTWARGDSVRLMAIADIGAGVDLSVVEATDFTVTENGVVEATLPRAEILYVAVDNQESQVLDREKGFFTKGDPRLETEARQVAESVLVESALEKGILEQAEANATLALSRLLIGLGYSDVTVDFS